MSAKAQAIFTTRIVDFRAEPLVAKVGDTIKISGALQWYCPPIMCPPFGSWQPYENATIELYVDDVKVKETKTVAGGKFYFTITFDESGEHKIQAHYPGSWKDSEAWSDPVFVKVLTEKQYEQYQMRTWITYGLIGLGIVVAGIVAVEIIRTIREEELEQILLLR